MKPAHHYLPLPTITAPAHPFCRWPQYFSDFFCMKHERKSGGVFCPGLKHFEALQRKQQLTIYVAFMHCQPPPACIVNHSVFGSLMCEWCMSPACIVNHYIHRLFMWERRQSPVCIVKHLLTALSVYNRNIMIYSRNIKNYSIKSNDMEGFLVRRICIVCKPTWNINQARAFIMSFIHTNGCSPNYIGNMLI